MKTLNVAIIGTKFMGKAHSNAWLNAPHFFDLPAKPVLKVACGQDRESLQVFANTWGWEEIETDWKKVIARPDINIIDISLHRQFDGKSNIIILLIGIYTSTT